MALPAITARDQDFEDSVRMHITRGVAELASVASCLLRAQEDPSVYAEVREHIEEATQELSRAEGLAQHKLKRVDSVTLEMMDQKKKRMDEQKVLSENLGTLQAQLRNLEILQRDTIMNCKKEGNRKESAQMLQKSAINEAKLQRNMRNAALCSMLIPVVGATVVSGGVMAVNAHQAMKTSKKSAASANDIVHKCMKKEIDYGKEAKEYVKLIEEQKKRILENQRRINAIEEEKDTLVRFQKEVLDLQEALRHCSHFVSSMASQASAAEIISRYVCTYDCLRNQLNEMSNQILPVLGVKRIGVEGMEILSNLRVQISIRKLKCLSRPSNIFLAPEGGHD